MDKLKNMSDNFEITDEDLEEFTLPDIIEPILSEQLLSN
jgi:hypothetical protein